MEEKRGGGGLKMFGVSPFWGCGGVVADRLRGTVLSPPTCGDGLVARPDGVVCGRRSPVELAAEATRTAEGGVISEPASSYVVCISDTYNTDIN